MTTTETTTTCDALCGLLVANGGAVPEEEVIAAACNLIESYENVLKLDIDQFVAKTNQMWKRDYTATPRCRFMAFAACYEREVGDALDIESQMVLVAEYLDHINKSIDDGEEFEELLDWLFNELDMEKPRDLGRIVTEIGLKSWTVKIGGTAPAMAESSKPAAVAPAPEPATEPAKKTRGRKKKADEAAPPECPGQQSLPLTDTAAEAPAGDDDPVVEPEPAGGKRKGLPDLTGKRVKYRPGKEWVVGTVTKGAGQNITFTQDDNGEQWSNVDRTLCKLLRPRPAPAPSDTIEPPPLVPVKLTIPVRAREVKKYQKLLADPESFVDGVADYGVLATYEVVHGAHTIRAEVTNGARGEPEDANDPLNEPAVEQGCYLDIYVAVGPDVVYEYPSVQTLAGDYTLKLPDVVFELSIIPD